MLVTAGGPVSVITIDKTHGIILAAIGTVIKYVGLEDYHVATSILLLCPNTHSTTVAMILKMGVALQKGVVMHPKSPR